MPVNQLLGFDVRVSQKPRIASADVVLWPRVEGDAYSDLLEELASETQRATDTLVNYVNLLACVPRRWLADSPLPTGDAALIAVIGEEAHAKRLERLYPDFFSWYRCEVSEETLARAGWPLLGYDVIDSMLNTSSLRIDLESGAMPRSTMYGLCSDMLDARSQASAVAERIPEHSPFFPVAIYGHPKCFPTK